MDARGRTVVARPRKAVFEFMDVPENQARISPRLSAVETVGTRDNGAKRATYTYRLFGLAFDGEVRGIDHDPPERVTFEMTGDITGHIQWEFEPTGRGTRVTYAAEYDLGLPSAVTRLSGPLIDRFNQREITRTLENLRRALEATESP
ncbi:SRPBCC family protein [Haloarcula sp. S1CR25-12]|uniref:SRPBCC family protein n=1 Tax=Haloarcula saliterrae TaxID=2950534 RepID=A0ABU2FG75_9EURY|nr:SRPBCC family protein [Haloarcula sp. S1CR25-12]MDS0261244.1 SRPBCC family protein [Haloarcula sp. S1CR25-12]